MRECPRVTYTALALAVALAGCDGGLPAASDSTAVHSIGLTTDAMNYHSAQQQASQWCWAACIQMALSTRGIDIPQERIVRQAFGESINHPGDVRDILKSLNGTMQDRSGRNWRLKAQLGLGPPSFELLRTQLERGIPLIVGVRNPGLQVGHAIVITAVVYVDTPDGPQMRRILVRDPSPSQIPTFGKRALTSEEFSDILVFYEILATPS